VRVLARAVPLVSGLGASPAALLRTFFAANGVLVTVKVWSTDDPDLPGS
jgi:hypothetical protein